MSLAALSLRPPRTFTVASRASELARLADLARQLGILATRVRPQELEQALRAALAAEATLESLRTAGVGAPGLDALRRFSASGFGDRPAALRRELTQILAGATRRTGDSTTLVQVVDRLLVRHHDLVRRHQIFPKPVTLTELRENLLPYVARGEKMYPDERTDQFTFALFSIARMVVLEPEFPRFRDRVFDLFPEAPRRVNRVGRSEVEAIIDRLLSRAGLTGRQRTSMVLGAGRDVGTIEMGLARGDRVVAVDRSHEAIGYLRQSLEGWESRWPGAQLVLEEASYADPELMLRYYDAVDVAYLLLTNNLSHVTTALNTVRRGGVVVTEDMGDLSPAFLQTLTERGRLDGEWELARQFTEATPPYETPWTELLPTNMVVNVMQRDRESSRAGRLFLTVPEEDRLAMEQLSASVFVSFDEGQRFRPLEVAGISHSRLGREPALTSFVRFFTRYAVTATDAPNTYLDTYLALLDAWLRKAPGRFPVTGEEFREIIDAAREAIGLPIDRSKDPLFLSGLIEIVHGIVPRQLASLPDDEFEHHRDWIGRTFPTAPYFREGLKQPIPRDAIRAALAFPQGQDQTTFFLGPSLSEEGLIRDAVRGAGRRGTVYLVDNHPRVRRQFEELLADRDLRRSTRFLEEDFTSDRFLARHRGTADRVVLLYPNRDDALEAVTTLSKPKGRIVLQTLHGGIDWSKPRDEQLFAAAWAALPARTDTVVLVRNTAPVIRTRISPLFPAGNILYIGDLREGANE